jgi:hypothetical protein
MENPDRLVSLLEMLRFNAHHFVAISNTLGAVTMDIASGQIPQQRSVQILAEHCKLLRASCEEIDMPITCARIDRFFSDAQKQEMSLDDMRYALKDIQLRVWDELNARLFLSLRGEAQHFYATPLRDWESTIERFPSIKDDVEESGKCYALERYGGCIFHLMRITEAVVIEIGRLVDPNDHKPQFGSVLRKIDNLIQKTKWPDWPESSKPHQQFFADVLPRLYAVKDSWRDKALHFDLHIIPSDAISNAERAMDVYNSTLSLARMIAERLP